MYIIIPRRNIYILLSMYLYVYNCAHKMKERITVTLDKELLDWIDFKVKERVFANRSHGFEFLIADIQRKGILKDE